MNQPTRRRGVMTLRTLGRGFWIGIVASILLHVVLISTGHFQMPRLADIPVLEARLEPAEPEQIPPAEPAPENKSAPEPEQQAPQQELPVLAAQPEFPVLDPQPENTVAESSTNPPPPVKAEAIFPPAPTGPGLPPNRPYATLTQAVQNIRELPAHIEIVYELQGMLSGRQTHVWARTGQQYTLKAEAEATGLTGLFVGGKIIQESRGLISSLGLMPEQYEIQRPSGKNEILRFDYAANLVESVRTDPRRGEKILSLPLIVGVQDPLSSIYQLAMAAKGDKDGLLVAASAKRVKGYPYRTLGTETLNTALGEMNTVHVTRSGDSDKGAVHLWLAPQRYFLPVKVTYIDEEGTDWVLEAVSVKAQ